LASRRDLDQGVTKIFEDETLGDESPVPCGNECDGLGALLTKARGLAVNRDTGLTMSAQFGGSRGRLGEV